MAININRQDQDPFNRYKMEQLMVQILGKGNGVKTAITNLHNIAKSLNRPPDCLMKFLSCELGAGSCCKNNTYTINGQHTPAELQDTLDRFIAKFVLCTDCENPETKLVVKSKKLYRHCTACGHLGLVDMNHKLSGFILKNAA